MIYKTEMLIGARGRLMSGALGHEALASKVHDVCTHHVCHRVMREAVFG